MDPVEIGVLENLSDELRKTIRQTRLAHDVSDQLFGGTACVQRRQIEADALSEHHKCIVGRESSGQKLLQGPRLLLGKIQRKIFEPGCHRSAPKQHRTPTFAESSMVSTLATAQQFCTGRAGPW